MLSDFQGSTNDDSLLRYANWEKVRLYYVDVHRMAPVYQ